MTLRHRPATQLQIIFDMRYSKISKELDTQCIYADILMFTHL